MNYYISWSARNCLEEEPEITSFKRETNSFISVGGSALPRSVLKPSYNLLVRLKAGNKRTPVPMQIYWSGHP